MKTLFLSAWIILCVLVSCNSSTPIQPVAPGTASVHSGARDLASDVTGQWKLSYIYSSTSPYDLNGYDAQTGCSSGDVWLYIDPSGYATITNRNACSGQTQSGLEADYYAGKMALETWNNMPGETVRWALTTYVSGYPFQFYRVGSGTGGVGRLYNVSFNPSKTSMSWERNTSSGYYYVYWTRASGGPSLP